MQFLRDPVACRPNVGKARLKKRNDQLCTVVSLMLTRSTHRVTSRRNLALGKFEIRVM
jgi:hypothetical protein